MFPYLIGIFIFGSLFEGFLFFILMVCQLLYIYTYITRRYELFHLDVVIKALILVLTVIYTYFKFQFVG